MKATFLVIVLLYFLSFALCIDGKKEPNKNHMIDEGFENLFDLHAVVPMALTLYLNDLSDNENGVLRLHSMDSGNTNTFPVVYFTQKELKLGNMAVLSFKHYKPSSFKSLVLPKEKAESIPFSYKQLSHILELFSFSPESSEAKTVKIALRICESKPLKGETKLCATSFDSMVDFVRSTLGSKTEFKALTTTHLSESKSIVQNYTIIQEPEEILVPMFVGCHPLDYPYKVYVCHSHVDTKVFKVSVAGDNGDRIEALALCHTDTTYWGAMYEELKQVGIMPASTDVCHYISSDHLVWIPTQA